MNIQIKSLYDLQYGHIILPSELIANAKLPNYEHVKFLTNNDGLVVECLCVTDDGSKVTFNYYFDDQDKLKKLIMFDGLASEVLFDREQEVKKLRNGISAGQLVSNKLLSVK